MQKKIFLWVLILIASFTVIGCGKKDPKKDSDDKLLSGWEAVFDEGKNEIPQDILNTFNNAKEGYVGMNFEPVALLASQVVSGTNYMFLCKGTTVTAKPVTGYKIVIVYKDLEDNARILSVKDFNFTKYVNENYAYDDANVTGGWNVVIPETNEGLSGEMLSIFTDATADLLGGEYQPIAVLGRQLVSGTNYAILCYGKLSIEKENSGIYLLTINQNLKGTSKLVSGAYVDLTEYNNQK